MGLGSQDFSDFHFKCGREAVHSSYPASPGSRLYYERFKTLIDEWGEIFWVFSYE